LLAALPNLSGILQIPGGVLGRRFESFKGVCWAGRVYVASSLCTADRLALLHIPADLALTILAVLVGAAWVSNNIVGPITTSGWLRWCRPPRGGFYFSRRNALMGVVGAVVGIVGGVLLDAFKRSGNTAEGFSVVFGLGHGLRRRQHVLFHADGRFEAAEGGAAELAEGIAALRTPFGDKGFRTVLVFIGVFVVGQQFPGSLFTAYAIERSTCHYNYSNVGSHTKRPEPFFPPLSGALFRTNMATGRACFGPH